VNKPQLFSRIWELLAPPLLLFGHGFLLVSERAFFKTERCRIWSLVTLLCNGYWVLVQAKVIPFGKGYALLPLVAMFFVCRLIKKSRNTESPEIPKRSASDPHERDRS
jgi:hypothetical protein